jgi:LacI family transcriptional regulator
MKRRTTGGTSTIEDVARLAGVSTASVSRVINTPEKVGPEIRARVQEALKELRYLRNGAARALAARRSHTVGAVVPTLGAAIFATGVEALQRRLEGHGYALLVSNSRYDPELEARQVRTLIERGIDGIVLVGHRRSADVYRLLNENRVPYVCTYTYAAGPHACVGFDHAAAARQIVDYLLDLGHGEFGVITTPPRENDRIAGRLEGVLQGLSAAGLPRPEIVEADYSIADGRSALRVLLSLAPRVTAVVCTTDGHAVGALAEARAQRIEVPQRLSITGFDDLELSANAEPSLTTVAVPAREIGERAADLIIARIDGRQVPHLVELRTTLSVRGSTGRGPG